MAWEWVAPAATAAVGIVGIAATWLTARASRIDQRNMVFTRYEQAKETALRETRQAAYVKLLADFYNVFDSTASAKLPAPDPENDIALMRNLRRSVAEAKIVGSDAVRQLADQAQDQISSYWFSVIFNRGSNGIYAEQEMRDRENAKNVLYMLERLMAKDLGISV